jgi:lysophospholipase L1-like esterase
MIFKPLLLTAALMAAPLGASAQAGSNVDPPLFRASKIVLIGDSTMAVKSGWGAAFCADHLSSFVACIDLARGGRSSGSYRAEGSWTLALKEIASGGFADTYVLIQFGHNDQPGKPGRSTDLATEFPANMKRYVEEVRAVGGKPILVTPLTRRQFKDGRLIDDLGPWAGVIKAVAAETGTPLIDLHARSMAAVMAMGPVEATRLAQAPPPPEVLAAAGTGTTISVKAYEPPIPGGSPAPAAPPPAPPPQTTAVAEPMGQPKVAFDYTHLGRDGAEVFAAMVAKDLADLVPALRRHLNP